MSSHVMWRMSRYLTYEHILEDTQAGMEKLMDLFDALPYGSISFSKGLGPGASEWALKEQDKTAMPPSVKNALGHVLAGGNINPYSPVLPDDIQAETSNVGEWLEVCGEGGIDDCRTLIPYYEAADKFRQATPGAGAYFNEADTFEEDWQEQFWGTDNYNALLSRDIFLNTAPFNSIHEMSMIQASRRRGTPRGCSSAGSAWARRSGTTGECAGHDSVLSVHYFASVKYEVIFKSER